MRAVLLAITLLPAVAQDPERVTIPSSRDRASQPMLVWQPPAAAAEPVPLLVHLHSWSSSYDSSDSWKVALAEAQKRGWAFVSPDFRGPNDRPAACASPLARQDILDSVADMRKRTRIDAKRIYLLGGSGGGHMALVMAAHAPKLWAAVSAWVPISDLAAWHAESTRAGARYAAMLEKCCGGPPADARARREYELRSPLPMLAQAKGLPVRIETGIHDGHTWEGKTGSVPVSHSLRAFNTLARANGRAQQTLAEADIEFITTKERIPPHLLVAVGDSPGRKRPILFRREAGPASLVLFDGGHETDFGAAVEWFASLSAR